MRGHAPSLAIGICLYMNCRLLNTLALSSLCLGLSGCGYFDSRAAHKAQVTMIGMTSYDLQACAGLPSATKQLNDTTQIFIYNGTQPQPSYGGSTLIPVGDIVTTINQLGGGGGTTCSAVIRLDHDRVADVHYTGNNDELIGSDGICSIITRGCSRQPEGTMNKNTGSLLFGPVSAFHEPKGPNQSAGSTYSSQSGTVELNPAPNSKNPVIIPRLP